MLRMLLLAHCAIVVLGAARAQETGSKPRGQTENYLGVIVAPVPAALRAHLRDILDVGQGIVVEQVSPGSPAARGGIRQHDILVSQEEREITSREALEAILHAVPRNAKISLTIVRVAKVQSLEVQLEQRPKKPEGSELLRAPSLAIGRTSAFMRTRGPTLIRTMSVTIEQDRLTAALTYLDTDGREQKRKVRGTKDGILHELRGLPAAILTEIRKKLDEVTSFDPEKLLFHISLKPSMNESNEPIVRVTLRRLSQQGVVESLVFDAAANVEAIVKHLQGVPDEIRDEVEKALRKARIPKVHVTVDRSL